MPSPSFLDRLTSPRRRSPILPLHRDDKSQSIYDLDELDPQPEDALLHDETPRAARPRRRTNSSHAPSASPDAWLEDSSPPASPSKTKPKVLFARPPPPIAASRVLSPSRSARAPNQAMSLMESSRANIRSLLFEPAQEQTKRPVDSEWRALRRVEKGLEKDVQELLDFQVAALTAGSGGLGSTSDTGTDVDGHSDAGSSTPTGTFYSTATSKSRMAASLYVPPKAGPDGHLIPVRQPKRRRTPGLRAIRGGLRDTLVAMGDLKQEEEARIDDALAERKKALLQLKRLVFRRDGLSKELESFEQDDEEELGRELREMGSEYDTLGKEIRMLEEKLVGMRNRRRSLRDKMAHIESQREAGLSGHRGALREVNTQVTSLLRRPPIQPLDTELLDSESAASGGHEFLQLIPERRTADMARDWWESEVAALTQRQHEIKTGREALEAGNDIWTAVMQQVTDFEASLRALMRAVPLPEQTGKGKEKVLTREEAIRSQLPIMETTLHAVEAHMELAEEKGWTLLICAIGAELEAFRQAYDMLRGMFDVSPIEAGQAEVKTQSNPEESDNEVPPDLLISGTEEGDGKGDAPGDAPATSEDIQRVESENEVPPEFLVEHGKGEV